MPLRPEYPEFLLLLIPLFWFYRQKLREDGVIGWIRILLLLLCVLALTRPSWEKEGESRNLILLIDRSASLPPGSPKTTKELLKLVRENQGPNDKIGIVTFGQGSTLEAFPSHNPAFSEFYMAEGQPASDLAEGLELARKLLGKNKGKILLLSDGKYTGLSPHNAALELLARGIPVDYRYTGEELKDDVSIAEVSFPDKVEIGKPFQYSIWVESSQAGEGTVEVYREGKLISNTKLTLSEGKNRFLFWDLVASGGSFTYQVVLKSRMDQTPQNNKGLGIVRAETGPMVLVITPKGRRDNFTRALEKSRIPLEIRSAGEVPTKLAGLDRYRAVIIENVSARDLHHSLDALKKFVEDLGGGLLMTGGKQSFGVGGYYKSTLDPVLPVSMELRKEHHKLRVAMAIVLDRSGSMSMPAGGGRNKMDLANLGTCAVIDLLSPQDQVAVIAVDSSPHVIIPLQNVDDPQAIQSKVRTIQSMGGGIYTYTALKHAADILKKSDFGTRHIVLFADAADAEEPGTYKKLLKELQGLGITVSVIALGSPSDPDAVFLKDVARRGMGRIFFANKAEDLPQLFAQETITIAKSSFVDEAVPTKMNPGFFLLGAPPSKTTPPVGGFNLTYLRPQASQGTQTDEEEYHAPVLASWYRGTGRVAAFTGEVDGKYTGALASWKGYGDYFITVVRWLVGDEPPRGYYVESHREGGQAQIYLEMEDEKAPPPKLKILTPLGKKIEVDFAIDQGGYKGTFPLRDFGVYFPVLEVKQKGQKSPRVIRCSPLTLPYPPEFIPEVQKRDGKEVLKKIAQIAKGKELAHLGGVFEDIPFVSAYQPLTKYLAMVLLILLLLEISGRRLGFFGTLQVFFVRIWQSLPSRPGKSKGPEPLQTPEWAKSSLGSVEKIEGPSKKETAPAPSKDTTGVLLSKAKKKARDRM